MPFLVLASAPELVCVVLTPFELVCDVAPRPVLELYVPADCPLLQTVRPVAVRVQSAAKALDENNKRDAKP